METEYTQQVYRPLQVVIGYGGVTGFLVEV